MYAHALLNANSGTRRVELYAPHENYMHAQPVKSTGKVQYVFSVLNKYICHNPEQPCYRPHSHKTPRTEYISTDMAHAGIGSVVLDVT